ncbi:MAG: Excinuclease ABC C subunit domain protein [Candidatus Moranbacteria bacterium GW2011_GWD2_36_12]|nr:MAG: Excinuclease ABC C subunit domain protein [Candidatus Moranbacteria bacterium GW2011_GWD2_36_12]
MKRNNFQDIVKKLPQALGVYFFRGGKGKILYIGKATNLRSRVASYFRGQGSESDSEFRSRTPITPLSVAGRSEWIGLMVSQVVNIDFEQTDSVLEALILESNSIKKHQPKYNTLEKDDKSFSYFVVTKEEFPKVLIVRKTDLKNYVIPNLFRNLEEPSEIPELNSVQALKQVQDGKKTNTKKLMPEKLKAIYGPYTSKQQMQIALKIIRRIFPFHAGKQKTEKGCLDFQIGMCPGPYADAISKVDYRKNICGIEMILQGKKKSLISRMEKEMQTFSKRNEFEKAAVLRNKIFALQHIRDVALMTRDFEPVEFSKKLTPNKLKPARIEAYDISNISGDHAVGSMVVFSAKGGSAFGGENWLPEKSQYRKFKIKTVEGSNDVAMMKEVLSRRFNNDWTMPDLILLDGGQGHVNMAGDLVRELGLDVLIVGVAKGKTRKNLQMTQFPRELQDFLNDKNSVKHIMDEAHRFAISYHRKLRSKNSLK